MATTLKRSSTTTPRSTRSLRTSVSPKTSPMPRLAAAKAAKTFEARERHLRGAIDLLIPLAHQSMSDPTVALQAAASTLDWLRLTNNGHNSDEIRTITTGAYEAALSADAIGGGGALGYAALLLKARAGVQENVMDARADLDRSDELEQMAHVREGVATVDLVTIATP